MKTVCLSVKEHKGKSRLFAGFSYDKILISIVKGIPGARWSMSNKMWHFDLNRQVVNLLREQLVGKATVDLSLLRKQWAEKKQKKDENRLTIKAKEPNLPSLLSSLTFVYR